MKLVELRQCEVNEGIKSNQLKLNKVIELGLLTSQSNKSSTFYWIEFKIGVGKSGLIVSVL